MSRLTEIEDRLLNQELVKRNRIANINAQALFYVYILTTLTNT
jgi:hypothetical protein